MSEVKRKRQPVKQTACVMLIGLAAWLTFFCLLERSSTAQEREKVGDYTLRSARELSSQLPESEADFIWSSMAYGAMGRLYSVGGACNQRITVPEIAAYLRYTAKDTQTVAMTLGEFWLNRQCTLQSFYDLAYTNGYGAGFSAGMDMAAHSLLAIRESEDTSYLESLIQKAEAAEADDMTKVMGLVSGARLAELRWGGQAPIG